LELPALIGRAWHRRFLFLSLLAMLSAILNAPFTASMASANAVAGQAIHVAADGMPCHKAGKPANHCPGCAGKTCTDGSACFAKCFQQNVPMASGQFVLLAPFVEAGLVPPRAEFQLGWAAPPLLRPPIA